MQKLLFNLGSPCCCIEQRRHRGAYGPVDHLGGEDLILGLLEAAFVLLPINPSGERPPLLFEKLLGDPGTVAGRDLVALPPIGYGGSSRSGGGPRLVEDTP